MASVVFESFEAGFSEGDAFATPSDDVDGGVDGLAGPSSWLSAGDDRRNSLRMAFLAGASSPRYWSSVIRAVNLSTLSLASW